MSLKQTLARVTMGKQELGSLGDQCTIVGCAIAAVLGLPFIPKQNGAFYQSRQLNRVVQGRPDSPSCTGRQWQNSLLETGMPPGLSSRRVRRGCIVRKLATPC